MVAYTSEQKKILSHDPDKHARILAGPGTGKSLTLIHYVAELRKSHPNKKVRLLTFTRAANGELMEKVLEEGFAEVVSSTVHSFAISTLLDNPGATDLPAPLRIADDWEWKNLIRKDLSGRLGVGVRLVDKLKIEMSSYWESLVKSEEDKIEESLRNKFVGLWEEHRNIFGYTLLSELPFRLREALSADENLNIGEINIAAVDEYQDLNACDLECFNLLAKRGVSILAVGDDDQSIYGFRKAHPEGIRKFVKEYEAEDYPLTVSHRCGSKILDWANFVIEGDTSRPKKKRLRPGNSNPEGVAKRLVFNREESEANGVTRIVKYLVKEEKIPPEEVLILVRTDNLAKQLREVLDENKVGYLDPEVVKEKLHSDSSRKLLSLLRLYSNRKDSLAWWTLLNLKKGIGAATISEICKIARDKRMRFGDVLLEEFEQDFRGISGRKQTLKRVVKETLDLLKSLDFKGNGDWGHNVVLQIKEGKLPEVPMEVKELFIKMDEILEGLQDTNIDYFVNQIEPLAKDISNVKESGKLRIMTISRSKGLTARAVIIAGVEGQIIPHPKVSDKQEERRLLYVGMTRARDFLYITRTRRRVGQTAWVGQAQVGKTRIACPFLSGGPVGEENGESYLKSKGC